MTALFTTTRLETKILAAAIGETCRRQNEGWVGLIPHARFCDMAAWGSLPVPRG